MSYLLYSSQTGRPFIVNCEACTHGQCLVCKVLDTLTNNDPFYYDSENLYCIANRSTGAKLEMVNHQGQHWGVLGDINTKQLISIEKISSQPIFLFKYPIYSVVHLNNTKSFIIDSPVSIYSGFNGNYITIVQVSGGVVEVYDNCELIKTITIPSLIKVLGIINRNKIYCLLTNGFAKYELGQ
jgi:hypothetical protein